MTKGLALLAQQLAQTEQQCAQALAKAQQDLALYMDQQAALNQYRQIYHQQWTDKGLIGISPAQNSQYHSFINKLEQAATQQYEGVLQVKQALELRKQAWLAASARRKAIELLLQKQAQREQLKQAKTEQKQQDEWVMRRYSP